MSAPAAKRSAHTVIFKGIPLEKLTTLNQEELCKILDAKSRRNLLRMSKNRNLATNKHLRLIRKINERKAEGAKAKPVKTHIRDLVITPEMIGARIEIYSGKAFVPTEIKPNMVGHFLGEFSLTYKPVHHGKVGIGATRSSKFVPLR